MIVPAHVRRYGSWNLRVGRKPAVVLAEVATFLDTHNLDVFTVCEAAGYMPLMAEQLPKVGYDVAWVDGAGSAKDSGVVYRSSLVHSEPALHGLGGIEWERKPGRPGLHWARTAVSTSVDGVKVLAVHLPPGPFGPRFPLRRLAYAKAARRVRYIGKRWNRLGKRWVMAGDWNKPTTEAGSRINPSPAWIAKSLGATVTGNGIDYVLSKGVEVTKFERHDYGNSDHRPVTFTVSY